MESIFYKNFKCLVLLAALVTGVTTQAMELQQEQYPFLIDTLESAIREKNPKLCAEIFDGFSQDIIDKEPIEQIGIFVDLIGQAAPRNAQITTAFCNALVQICGKHQESASLMQEHMGTLIDTLHKNNNTAALEKLTCIFADNTESREYKAIQDILEEKRRNNNLYVEEDEKLAIALQEDQFFTQNHDDEELDVERAVAESLQDNQPTLYPSLGTHNIIPSAPAQEEIIRDEQQEDDEELAQAFQESLYYEDQTQQQAEPAAPNSTGFSLGYVAGSTIKAIIGYFTKP